MASVYAGWISDTLDLDEERVEIGIQKLIAAGIIDESRKSTRYYPGDCSEPLTRVLGEGEPL